MADQAHNKTDKDIKKVENKIKTVYGQANKELQDKYNEFMAKYEVKDQMWQDKINEVKKTDPFGAMDLMIEYQDWQKGQVFQGQQWQAKINDMSNTLLHANEAATNIVNSQMIGTFMDHANYESYYLEHEVGVNFGFNLYDEATVAKLIKEDPTLLPKKKVDIPKDLAWNKKNISNAVTQGIIQGESLDKVADRFKKVVGMNQNSALTNARTSMTSAQNAGREQSLKRAKEMGIDVYKQWMSTLDERTRQSHRDLDGEKVKVGDKWHHYTFSNGLRYPADPLGAPQEVYNCRCTMVGDISDYPSAYERYDNIDGKPIKNMTYNDWYKAKGLGNKSNSANVVDYSKYGSKEVFDVLKKMGTYENYLKNGEEYEATLLWEQYKDLEEIKKAFQTVQPDIKAYEKAMSKAKNEASKAAKKAEKQLTKLEAEIGAVKDQMQEMVSEYGSWEGIWFKDVTLEDYPTKLSDGSIAKKKQWYIEHIETSADMDKVEKWKGLLGDLEEYEKLGEEYMKMYDKYKDMNKEASSLRSVVLGVDDKFTQARKDAAVWARSSKEADNVFRKATEEVWATATKEQKYAAWDYTAGSGKFNRPLRGYDGSWRNPVGVGKVSLNNEGGGKEIEQLTKLLENSRLQQDTWLQRGIETYDGLSNFVGVPESVLREASQEELEQLLLGKEISDAGFMSCGSAKGTGFSGSILNIYAPEGTQALYCEPFSQYGGGAQSPNWDGKSTQSHLGRELETLMQRNTFFRITKVEKTNSRIFLDIEVIDQKPYDIVYKMN